MKRLASVLALLLWANFASAEPPEVASDLTTTPQRELILHLSFITSASPEKLWSALTSPAELTRWAAPRVQVELRIGGAYEHHYRPNLPAGRRGLEGMRIISYVPSKMLSYAGASDTWVVWTIEPAGDQQVLHYHMLGTGDEWLEKGPTRMGAMIELMEKLAKYVQP